MAIPSLSDLLKDKTISDYFDELVQACIDEGLEETAWQPGEPIRAVMSIVARVLFTLWGLVARPALRAAFLDYATGAWLTLYAWTACGVKRKGAEFATRGLTIENTSGSFYTIVAGEIRIKNSVTKKTFTNTTGGTILAWSGSGAYPTQSLVFTADEAGTASDTLPEDLDLIPITGPTGVRIKTAAGFVGSDGEEDPALVVRCKASMGPLSPAGPKAAYLFTALSTYTADGAPVAVNRVRVVDLGNCKCEVWLASASGPTPGDMSTAGTDVFLVYAALLAKVVPFGFKAFVYGSPEVEDTLDVQLVVDMDSGLTKEEAEHAATAAISDYLSRVPIGGWHLTPLITTVDSGKLLLTELQAKASEAAPGIIKATATLGSAATDLTIAYNKIPNLGTPLVTATLVKQ